MNLVDKGAAEYAASIRLSASRAASDWDLQKYVEGFTEDPATKVDLAPLLTQVGGDHYKDQELQPIEACWLRYGYIGVKASLHCKVDKYLTREKGNEREQLEKAAHCIALLIEFYDKEQLDVETD